MKISVVNKYSYSGPKLDTKEIVNDIAENSTNTKNTLFSLLFSINLLRYCVENNSDVLCKINVDRVNTIAIDPPTTEPIDAASPLKASGDIVNPVLFNKNSDKKEMPIKNM
jgi:hypothetical protein